MQDVSLLKSEKLRVKSGVWAGLPAGEGWVEEGERKGVESGERETRERTLVTRNLTEYNVEECLSCSIYRFQRTSKKRR